MKLRILPFRIMSFVYGSANLALLLFVLGAARKARG
jgi:hypothetical protein